MSYYYRPAGKGGCRLGGTGTTVAEALQKSRWITSTGSCRYHGADGGNDGVRLHSGSSGDGSDGLSRILMVLTGCFRNVGGLQNH